MHLAVIQPKLELDRTGDEKGLHDTVQAVNPAGNDFDVFDRISLRILTIAPPSLGKVRPCFFDRGDDVMVAGAAAQIS
jgi:hypothetical protein